MKEEMEKMEITTTWELQIDIPECPSSLMKEMNENNKSQDRTIICKKCRLDKICNKQWVAVEDLKKCIQEIKKDIVNEYGKVKHKKTFVDANLMRIIDKGLGDLKDDYK